MRKDPLINCFWIQWMRHTHTHKKAQQQSYRSNLLTLCSIYFILATILVMWHTPESQHVQYNTLILFACIETSCSFDVLFITYYIVCFT